MDFVFSKCSAEAIKDSGQKTFIVQAFNHSTWDTEAGRLFYMSGKQVLHQGTQSPKRKKIFKYMYNLLWFHSHAYLFIPILPFIIHFGRSPEINWAPIKDQSSKLEIADTPWQQGHWTPSAVSLHRSHCNNFLELLEGQLFLLQEPFSPYLEGCTWTPEDIFTKTLSSLLRIMQTIFVYLIA